MNMHLKWNCGQGAALAATLVLGALVPCVSAAAEGGGSNYMPGTYGDFGAGMSPPSYLRNDVIFYEAGIGPRPINGGLDPGFEQDLWMDRLTLGGFMDSGSSGAKFGIELQIPYVFDLTVTQNPGGPPFNSFASPRDHAFGDPTIKPQIAWGAGPHYGKVSVGVVAPWGTHDEGNVLSVGRHYWSFDPSFSHTYRSDSGWDVSTTVGFMINLENHQSGPNYESGDEAHIDALIGKHFGENFALGVTGYWYHQIDDDKGPIPPPLEIGYQGDSTGYGPVIMFGNKNVSLVAKWIYENYADNRLRGDLYSLSFVARFGGEPPPAPTPVAPPPVARVEPPPPPPPPPPADADGDGVPDLSDLCPATPRGQRADVNGCSCDFTVQVHFRSNSTEITGADAITLDSLADQVRKLPTISGELGGHSDSQGPEAFNVDLSRRRALAVRDYLASRGITVTQLAVAGYGEAQPIADNTTDEGRQQNRRVVLSRTNCQVGPQAQ
jgi:outer membrane protein OmpA-like peptidoglycan-associated protein